MITTKVLVCNTCAHKQVCKLCKDFECALKGLDDCLYCGSDSHHVKYNTSVFEVGIRCPHYSQEVTTRGVL